MPSTWAKFEQNSGLEQTVKLLILDLTPHLDLTRLHVATLAAILGRPTYIVAGRHHKIPGIYEYSMARMPNVAMINAACEVIA